MAIPGLYRRGAALVSAPSGSDALTIGADASAGTRLTFRTDGSVRITQGAAVVVQIDADGTVHLGGAAGEFVALANLVTAQLTALQSAYDSHTHLYAPGPGAPVPTPAPIPLVGPLGPVAATKAKAT